MIIVFDNATGRSGIDQRTASIQVVYDAVGKGCPNSAPIALVLHITCVRTICVQCFGIPFRANCQTQHLCADSELKQVNMEGAGQQVRRAHCESTHAHE